MPPGEWSYNGTHLEYLTAALLHHWVVMNQVYLSSFKSCLPRYDAPQARILDFLKSTHEAARSESSESVSVGKWVDRYGVKASLIGHRYFECPDLWASEGKTALSKAESISHSDIQNRTRFFSLRALEIFNEFYQDKNSRPEHIIHVTCTGYMAPSAPQVLAADRNWYTEISHAYHMGCYASLPAIRQAWGHVLRGKTVDIVHNEMCSLHLHPGNFSPEQLVVQTLFADGHIFYQAHHEKRPNSFLFRHVKEKVISGTSKDMTWLPGPSGMEMTLSRDIPQKIESSIRQFTQDLISEAGLDFETVRNHGIFAIHPGGRKIIEAVANALDLKDEQTLVSRQILFERGNMSSATLPHIWEKISQSNVPDSTPVVSLAFGPGLTLFGSVFESQS